MKLRDDGPVVLVEDDDANAWLLRRCYAMSSLANEFLWLRSGLALMEYLRAVDAGTAARPALIMLDLDMQGLAGLRSLRLIESGTHFPAPEILLFTSSDGDDGRAAARRFGAAQCRTAAADPAETIAYFNSLAA